MEKHFGILIKVFVYVMFRYQSGRKLSKREKKELLFGLYALGSDFFSRYIVHDNQLGTTRVEVPALCDVCVPGESLTEDEASIHEVFQGSSVCPPVSLV
jgi:hypothetical protein